MKIDDLLKTQSIQGNTEPRKQGANRAEGDFSAMLQDEMSETGKIGSSPEISELNPAYSIAGLTAAGDPELAERVKEIEGVIGKLQSLEQALQANVSPKQVDQMVQEVSAAAGKLQATSNNLPGAQMLDDMVQEINVAAYMESVKWKRGDYL